MALDVARAIRELAELNDDPAGGGITREVYTPTYMRAVELVAGWMRDAGLEVRLDPVGNLFGRSAGANTDAPVVLTGSHIDTTLNAGRYDGVVGVVGAIAALERLRERGVELARPVEVVAWAGEEPRFGTGCIGSRCAAGLLDRDDLDRLTDRTGVTLAAALGAAGFEPEMVGGAVIEPRTVHALVELHIEQGAVLEAAGVPIGVVTAIAAPHDVRVIFEGAATHSGATPMHLRRDALAGAAEWMSALESLARKSSSGTTVATVGVLVVAPGAINVVPGSAMLEVDVRDSDEDARSAVVSEALTLAADIAGRRGLDVRVDQIVEDVPVGCAPAVVAALEAACDRLGIARTRMISGAYHDAMILGARVPIGMLFVPSAGGVSHHPDEFSSAEDIELGVEVLAEALAELAARP
jgi:ureidoglycolate amidohydrolase